MINSSTNTPANIMKNTAWVALKTVDTALDLVKGVAVAVQQAAGIHSADREPSIY